MSPLKQIIHIALTFLLLVATTGITLNKHYCLGRLRSVSVFHQTKASCCSDHSEEKMPCCNDEIQQLKIKEGATASFDFAFKPPFFELYVYTYPVFMTYDNRVKKSVSKAYFSPPPEGDITILTHALLI